MDRSVKPQSREAVDQSASPPEGVPDFRELYDSNCTYVWNTLRRLGVHEADLEDVVHEVFLAVYRRLGDYEPSRAIRPWLFGFCYRTASDYRGRAHRRHEVPDTAVDRASDAPGADIRLEALERQALVTAALSKIELGRRAVFVMHEIDGASIPEVATALGIPVNTAYSRLRLAHEEFTQAVRRLQARQRGSS
jgi:RNA polymerase sigma-70 factor (ECF subfamily)